MSLATAYGYKNNIIIKSSFSDGIEFFEGESLAVTDLDKMRISYSTDIAKGYLAENAPFEELHKLVTTNGYHYCAHHFREGHRNSEHAIKGFNLVIIDIDKDINMETARLLLKGYKCLMATTKRHTDENHRFRIIMPLSHVVELPPAAYSKFMENVFNWLPFNTDSQTKDIARKWESHKGKYKYQDGELLDAMLFIPQTKKEEEQTQKVLDNQSLNNLERWFHLNTTHGNRSNQLIKYALALVDSGKSVDAIGDAVHSFNNKLKDPLPFEEINNTILITAAKAVSKRDS